MSEYEDKFKKIVDGLNIDDKPDFAHREKLGREISSTFSSAKDKTPHLQTTSQPLRRTIMKNRITKLAAAAVIVIGVLLSITIFDVGVKHAYAIEQTIEALEHICSIKMSGIVTDARSGTGIEYVLWAKPNEDGTESGELCFDVPDQQIIIVNQSGTTYRYHPGPNIVYVKEYKDFTINPWLGSKFFHTVKRCAENWEVSYGEDEETGRDSIFATCTYTPELKSWWFQFDSETRLPVKFKQWKNIDFEGEPEFYAESIEYNPTLPDGIFIFNIPEGSEVVKLQQKLPEYLNEANAGISAEGLTDGEACLAITKDYWQATIDGDWEYLAQLRPICNAQDWELKYKRNENWPIEVVKISKPVQKDACKIGPVVSSLVKYSDGQIKDINLVVKIRNIDGNKSYVIAGTYGGTKEFER